MNSPASILRKKPLAGLLFASLIWQVSPAFASDSELPPAVSELGTLNGIALACSQPALSARARQIMIDTVPKERSIGEVFEQATQESFLAYGRDGKTCPDGKTLATQVDETRSKLRRLLNLAP